MHTHETARAHAIRFTGKNYEVNVKSALTGTSVKHINPNIKIKNT